MIKYSVCLDAVFNGKDIYDSINAVHEAGISTIEFWDYSSKDLNKLSDTMNTLGMNVSTFCMKPTGLNDKNKHQQFIDDLNEAIEVAKKLNADRLITLVGNDTGEKREVQHENILTCIDMAIPYLEAGKFTMMLEPLNILVDHMGYYLYSSAEAFDIVNKVNNPFVKIIFDIYHQQITEGNLINNITKNIGNIAHFHTAGNPGRHELNIGEINYPEIFKAIEKTNYSGYIGLEYFPVGDNKQSLKELP